MPGFCLKETDAPFMNARCCATPLHLAEAQTAEPGYEADMRNS